MLVLSETFTNVTFVGQDQQVRRQPRIKSNHTCILINACNSINDNQRNKPVQNWDIVKYHQLNKRPKKGTITKSY